LIDYIFKPIIEWPRQKTNPWEQKTPFAANYSDTLNKLDYELLKLKAKNVIIQIALREQDIRQDGLPRANALRPSHPGVILTFDKPKIGTLSFPCDACRTWQHNLRAIVLTLERLRLADLYGVTQNNEQYRGWAALPAPEASEMTVQQAADFIYSVADAGGRKDAVVHLIPKNVLALNEAYRLAAKMLHPDVGGNHYDFVKLQKANEILRKHLEGRQ
jgi:hypothetical protein